MVSGETKKLSFFFCSNLKHKTIGKIIGTKVNLDLYINNIIIFDQNDLPT